MLNRIESLILILLLTLFSTNSLANIRDSSAQLDNLYNENTQQDIDAAFAITQTFIQQGNQYIADRARETDAAQQQLDTLIESIPPNTQPTSEQQQQMSELAQTIDSNQTWQMGGAGHVIITALGGAASGNVMGSGHEFIQAAFVNTLQSYAAQEIKLLADELGSNTARAALHGILACAGASAQNADCSSAALGAASSVVLNNLITLSEDDELTNEEREAIRNIVGNLVTGITDAVGGDAVIANTAAQIESENNSLLWVAGYLGYLGYREIEEETAIGAVLEWLYGRGEEGEIIYGPDSALSLRFAESESAAYFEDDYRIKHGNVPPDGTSMDNFGRVFTWSRAWDDIGNSAAQAVGSYQLGTAITSNGVTTYTIQNPMSLRSLFFGRQLTEAGLGLFAFPPVHSGLMSDMHMTIQWQVPVSNVQQR